MCRMYKRIGGCYFFYVGKLIVVKAFLMNVWYENHFEEDLDMFRNKLNFTPFKKIN